MRHKEFEGHMHQEIGNKVWICDYRFVNGYDKKPARHIKPTLVEIRPWNEGKGHTYYSETCYIPYKKNGNLDLTKKINPFDNTGHRNYTGVDIQVFLTEKECMDYYKKLCKSYIPLVKQAIEEKTQGLRELITRLEAVWLNNSINKGENVTRKCLEESEKLEEFLKSQYTVDVTTEVFLHAWISLNDAEDIYDCLLTMEVDNKNYSRVVKDKLEVFRNRLNNEINTK